MTDFGVRRTCHSVGITLWEKRVAKHKVSSVNAHQVLSSHDSAIPSITTNNCVYPMAKVPHHYNTCMNEISHLCYNSSSCEIICVTTMPTHTHTQDPHGHTKIEHGLVSGVVMEPNEAQNNMSSKGNLKIWTNPTGAQKRQKTNLHMFTKQQNN